jgi:nucleotide-binding universal stress UspA family protein
MSTRDPAAGAPDQSVIAVVSEDQRHAPVLRRAIERARERGATLILFDVDARTSPLESPLPTNWSGEGEKQLFPHRLSPNDLDTAGRARLARQVQQARDAGVQAYGWLPENPDAQGLAAYARAEDASLVVLGPGDEPLSTQLGTPTEVVEPAPAER